jgi:hypothetical protein
MEVDISVLRTATDRLFDHLIEMNIEKLEIPYDYYWHIPKEQEYDVYAKPDLEALTIGQLSDDWLELNKVVTGNHEVLGYHFVWLSSILRAIGETIVS